MKNILVCLLSCLAASTFASCAHHKSTPLSETAAMNDPYIWLEDVESEKSLSWVRDQNAVMEKRLTHSKFYEQTKKDVRKIMLAKDRLPAISVNGDHVYNFWQDEAHERGLWRRTTITEYKKTAPKWETLLDVDQLARDEKENWVWKGSSCYPLKDHMCTVSLSRGGKDAVVTREYDLKTKKFRADGFILPEAKGGVRWIDENTVLVSTDFGPGTMTSSGYPRQVRLWKRGQKLSDTKILIEASADDMSTYGYTAFTPEGNWTVVARQKSFYTSEMFLVEADGKLSRLPVPDDAEVHNVFQNRALFTLRSTWKTNGTEYKIGQLLSISLKDLKAPPQLVYSTPEGQFFQFAAATKSSVFIAVLEKIQGKVLRLTPTPSGPWEAKTVEGTEPGNLMISDSDNFTEILLAQHEGFLSPSSIWMLNSSKPDAKFEKLKSLPARFDSKGFHTEQLEATSRDGTKISYFVIRPKDLKFDSKAPTILYGYGGFEVSLTPSYLGAIGKIWLEKVRGVYVLANIRGGGEYGPAWHAAALKENRQRAFDDFAAIAEDLIQRKITSPEHLSIMGGSNGGLLVGATMTQRPDLFKAVVCQVPLLDMLRYHKLLAGHSWMAEYGDPDDIKMHDVISKYSPYQNLNADKSYPEVFFMTSTKDDRVHPGHARKMAARMGEMKKPYLFFENMEGGHGASANLEQKVKFTTLMLSFLNEKLAPTKDLGPSSPTAR